MISLADKHVQEQMHALHEFEEDLKLMPQPPAGLKVKEQYKFKLGNIMVMAQDRSLMTVLALPWIMDHLPKYKATGPLGDQYKHYVHMPEDFVRELVFNALNGNLLEPVVQVWRSALVLAINKGRVHKEGLFKGQKAL